MSKGRRDQGTIEFWKSSSDLMAALILVLLLMIMLLILYIVQIPEEKLTDFDSKKTTQSEANGEKGAKHSSEFKGADTQARTNSSTGGGSGIGGDNKGDDEGDYPGDAEGLKSAVFVMLVDSDTKKIIREKDVGFELYSEKNALQILNTYYPAKRAYKRYATTKDGSFYLPEKVYESSYYLSQVTELEGYDTAKKVRFTIHDAYDWDNPFVVKVKMYPKRDVIRIQMSDKENGTSVAGGSFNVIAAEDIVTKDGTVRLKKGDKATEITCNEDGYGESERLYLGSYIVKQQVIPEYYASNEEPLNIKLKAPKKGASKASHVNVVEAERTKIEFILTDELDGSAIKSASFSVEGPEGTQNLNTDENGKIILDSVSKNATYRFTQIDAPGDYVPAEGEKKVKVSSTGRIGKKAEGTINVTNRMIRFRAGVRDIILRSYLADHSVQIMTKGGKQVSEWSSNGTYTEFTDLSPGSYYITLDRSDKKYPFVIRDTAEIQEFDVYIFTIKSVGAIALGTLLLVGLVYAVVKLLRRRKAVLENE